MFRQAWLIFARNLRRLHRDVPGMISRYSLVTLGGAFVGFLMWGAAANDTLSSSGTLMSHVGAVYIAAFALILSGSIKIAIEIEMRPILKREYLTYHYSIIPYACGDFIFDSFLILTMTMVFLLIVYWSIGFQGNFFYIYAVLCVFASSTLSLSLVMTVVITPVLAYDLFHLISGEFLL